MYEVILGLRENVIANELQFRLVNAPIASVKYVSVDKVIRLTSNKRRLRFDLAGVKTEEYGYSGDP